MIKISILIFYTLFYNKNKQNTINKKKEYNDKPFVKTPRDSSFELSISVSVVEFVK